MTFVVAGLTVLLLQRGSCPSMRKPRLLGTRLNARADLAA